jgi:HEAT repeat protein
MESGDVRALVRQLVEHTERLPPELESALLARGAEVVEPLVELLWDESLTDLDAPGKGWAPIHAVWLLERLKAPEAIEPLVKRLLRTQPGEVLHDVLLDTLEELGPVVAPAALEALASTGDPDARFGLLTVLASCGTKDERIYTALLAELQEDPEYGAIGLARYGDPRAIEPLKRALEAHPLDEEVEDLFALYAVVELKAAIEALGGTLDAAQRETVERAARARQRLRTRFLSQEDSLDDALPFLSAVREERPGRNEACWCGSGVKYKKCHLGEDRQV